MTRRALRNSWSGKLAVRRVRPVPSPSTRPASLGASGERLGSALGCVNRRSRSRPGRRAHPWATGRHGRRSTGADWHNVSCMRQTRRIALIPSERRPFLGPWDDPRGRAAWLLGCSDEGLHLYALKWPRRADIVTWARMEREDLVGDSPDRVSSSRLAAIARLAEVVSFEYAEEVRVAVAWLRVRNQGRDAQLVFRGAASLTQGPWARSLMEAMRARERLLCDHDYRRPFCSVEACDHWGGREAGGGADWRFDKGTVK